MEAALGLQRVVSEEARIKEAPVQQGTPCDLRIEGSRGEPNKRRPDQLDETNWTSLEYCLL